MLSRRAFLHRAGRLAGAGALVPALSRVSLATNQTRPPNIVLIFTDDQGYGDLGCFGAEGFETPNLDRMAREGMRFTDFHVSTAVCSASRAALMTGCYNKRVSIFGALFPGSDIGLSPEEETIAELLGKRGYTSGCFGKWHLGHHFPFLPLQQGFDEYLGVPYSHDMWLTHYDGKPITASSQGVRRWKLQGPPLPWMEDNRIVDHVRTFEDKDQITQKLTARAVRFIQRNRHQPFFLYFPSPMPHVPVGASEAFRGSSEQGLYGDTIQEIDWSVGQILQTLKDNDLDDNTLVVFATDNGPWLLYGNRGGSAGPLRDAKGSMWEGGCRVPCVMRWPGVIPAGATCDELASTIDLLPTFAALAQAPLPARTIDGIDLSGLLKGEAGATGREEFFFYLDRNLVAVRRGPWKLVFPHAYVSCDEANQGKDGWPGTVLHPRLRGKALYNLDDDIGETNNVIDSHPQVVADLEQLAEKARVELGDNLTKRAGRGVRPPGHV